MHKYFNKIRKFINAMIGISALTALVWGSFHWAEYSRLIQNKSIIITGNSIVDESEYQTFLLKEFDSEFNAGNISILVAKMEEHPYVAGARVSRHYPNNILIEVSERYPIALINDTPLLLVDNYNTVLPFRSNSFEMQIPIISIFDISKDLYPIGQQALSPIIVDVVQFLNRIKTDYEQLYKNISEVRLSKYKDYELILVDEPTKIIIGKSISWSKILVLREFEKSIIGHKILTDYAYLDLRYDNQVITKERRV